jgi:hypothetical protein
MLQKSSNEEKQEQAEYQECQQKHKHTLNSWEDSIGRDTWTAVM